MLANELTVICRGVRSEDLSTRVIGGITLTEVDY